MPAKGKHNSWKIHMIRVIFACPYIKDEMFVWITVSITYIGNHSWRFVKLLIEKESLCMNMYLEVSFNTFI